MLDHCLMLQGLRVGGISKGYLIIIIVNEGEGRRETIKKAIGRAGGEKIGKKKKSCERYVEGGLVTCPSFLRQRVPERAFASPVLSFRGPSPRR